MYQESRLEAITSKNIRSGWKASGCWPVSMAKPLMSRLLLENSQQTVRNEAIPRSIDRSRYRTIFEARKNGTRVPWSTPKKARDLLDQLAQFSSLKSPCGTQRILFRKLTKGFDEKDHALAYALQRIEALETQLAAQKPQKRKKVEMSPNSKFAGIEAIYRAENGDGEVDDDLSEGEASNVSNDVQECIFVA